MKRRFPPPALTGSFAQEGIPPRKGRGSGGWLWLGTLLLSGCSIVTPLPLTPIQVIEGSWPPPVEVTTSARSYTIKGDVFAFPALNFSLTRASQQNWQFQAGNNSVTVLYRQPSAEPHPSLSVQFIPLPPGTDFAALLEQDKLNQEQAGATVTVAARTIDGVEGQTQTIQISDPQSGIEVTTTRTYLLKEDVVTLIQAQAQKDDFAELKADFDKMIASIVLPGTPAEAAAEEEAPQE